MKIKLQTFSATSFLAGCLLLVPFINPFQQVLCQVKEEDALRAKLGIKKCVVTKTEFTNGKAAVASWYVDEYNAAGLWYSRTSYNGKGKMTDSAVILYTSFSDNIQYHYDKKGRLVNRLVTVKEGNSIFHFTVSPKLDTLEVSEDSGFIHKHYWVKEKKTFIEEKDAEGYLLKRGWFDSHEHLVSGSIFRNIHNGSCMKTYLNEDTSRPVSVTCQEGNKTTILHNSPVDDPTSFFYSSTKAKHSQVTTTNVDGLKELVQNFDGDNKILSSFKFEYLK